MSMEAVLCVLYDYCVYQNGTHVPAAAAAAAGWWEMNAVPGVLHDQIVSVKLESAPLHSSSSRCLIGKHRCHQHMSLLIFIN
jgi:hypothetical protein